MWHMGFWSQWVLGMLGLAIVTHAHADVFDDVPEAAGYEVVYALDITENGGFANIEIPYRVDNSSAWDNNFDRIAYYLQLKRPNEAPRFVFVSGAAFTTVGTELGLPVAGTSKIHQGPFEDMTVVSNVPEIVHGDNLEGGHLEIWSWNYNPANGARVPRASAAVFDFGDTPLPGEGMYGSFQIHNVHSAQTIFAYNRWNDNSPSDLGIGNNTMPMPDGILNEDWTFSGNAGTYEFRQLQILVRPGTPPPPPAIILDSPQACEVVQRQRGDVGTVALHGRISIPADAVEARFSSIQGGLSTEWTVVDDSIRDGEFSGRVTVRSGFYRVELKVMAGAQVVGTHEVNGVGVGEVFIIAGQSNSANHGLPALSPTDPRVCSTDGTTWNLAMDPQPIATGSGGSPWPAFGDLFAARYNVPVGMMSVGWGGTRVEQWLPDDQSNLFSRLQRAADVFGEAGVRAVLWHQGESDSLANTSTQDYAMQLATVIEAMRMHSGWSIPWGIARVAYLPQLTSAQLEAVVSGQNQVVEVVPSVFAGPVTDDLVGEAWRYDTVHFNERGLREHASRWVDAISLPQCHGFEGVTDVQGCDELDSPDAGTTTVDSGVTESDASTQMDMIMANSDAVVVTQDTSPPVLLEPSDAQSETTSCNCYSALLGPFGSPLCSGLLMLLVGRAPRRRRRA